MIKSVSKQKDLIVDGNQVFQNNEVIFTRKDIISTNKINIIKTEIKYKVDIEEKVIYVTIGNKKLNELKALLAID